MVHVHHRKKTPGGCIERVSRCGSGRDNVRGVVETMNAARSRPDWLATVQSGRKQVQSRVCTPGFSGFLKRRLHYITRRELCVQLECDILARLRGIVPV